MDMPTLHSVLRDDLLEGVRRAGEAGTQLLDLLAEREGVVRVGDQILLSSIAARLAYERRETDESLEVLKTVIGEARLLMSRRLAEKSAEEEKRAKRAERKKSRLSPPLPPKEIIRPGYKKLVRATGPLYMRSRLGATFQDYLGISKVFLDMQTRHDKLLRDALTFQTRSIRALSKTIGESGIQSLWMYSEPEYEIVPERVEKHPYWNLIDEIRSMSMSIPVSIWQKTESEKKYRHQEIEFSSPKAWLTIQQKAYARALNSLVDDGEIRCEGERKKKRFFC